MDWEFIKQMYIWVAQLFFGGLAVILLGMLTTVFIGTMIAFVKAFKQAFSTASKDNER